MTEVRSASRLTRSSIIWIALAVLALVVFFSGLTIPLVGPDEPRYSQVAREMFERGDWITPTLGGFNWFEKPALLYWLQIASYNLFGVSEFAARFGSALFGLGTVAALWVLGRRVYRKTDFANWLALIAASTVGLIAFAHGASFDIVLTFPITAALVCFYVYDSGQGSAPLIGFYFFVGLALLAKGLVGIVFPFAIVGLYYVVSWKAPRRDLILSVFWGTALAIAVAAVWYIPMYLRHGYYFIDEFFIQHHFQRYTSNKYLHPQPFYFFFWVLPLMTIPWTPFFFAAVWKLVRRPPLEQNIRSGLRRFAIVWLALPVLFFSFSGSKLPGYVLPALPPALILTADLLYGMIERSERWKYVVKVIAGATLTILIVGIFLFVPGLANRDSVKGLFEVANRRGFRDAPVVMLHGISHNAEFYAPGRIIRESDGKQKRLNGPAEVKREIEQMNVDSLLVLVPVEYVYQLQQTTYLYSDMLKDNGEWALVLVKVK
jgi:4-amino-4-deoxy-L-arabinose transferase-like glycosyltransferase